MTLATQAASSRLRTAAFAPIGDEGRAELVVTRLVQAISTGAFIDGERLPSESEFEYANRAGTVTPWPWGTDPDGGCGHANYADADLKSRFDNFVTASCSDGHVFTAPAGSYPANGFGLYDMAGNVVEWTQDCWNAGYEGAPDDGRAWESGDCALRVMRGGSWGFGPQALRVAARFKPAAAGRGGRAGFRVARD